MSHARSRAARLAMQTLPLGGYALYMIYMSWLKQKTELGKLSVVPNTVRGRSGGSPRAKQSRGPLPQRKGVAAPSQCAGVQDRSIVNHHIPLTYSVPSTIIAPWLLRCKLRGCYNNDSTGHLCGTVFVWFLELCR